MTHIFVYQSLLRFMGSRKILASRGTNIWIPIFRRAESGNQNVPTSTWPCTFTFKLDVTNHWVWEFEVIICPLKFPWYYSRSRVYFKSTLTKWYCDHSINSLIYPCQLNGTVGWVCSTKAGGLGSVPDQVIPKTLKMHSAAIDLHSAPGISKWRWVL